MIGSLSLRPYARLSSVLWLLAPLLSYPPKVSYLPFHNRFIIRKPANFSIPREFRAIGKLSRFSKLIPVIDKDADGYLEEDELKTHIKFMQKRYILKDVDRTWKNYDQTKLINGEKLPWSVYRDAVYGAEGMFMYRFWRRYGGSDARDIMVLHIKGYPCALYGMYIDGRKLGAGSPTGVILDSRWNHAWLTGSVLVTLMSRLLGKFTRQGADHAS